jgi:protein-disulfide isomerase
MKRKTLLPLALILMAVVSSRPALSQGNADVESMKKDMQALKEGQQAIQKDIQEIKKLLASRPAAGAPAADQAMNAVLSVDGEPFKGEKNAKLTLVEFSEFQCPFCGRHVRETYPQLEKEYIQTGKVKYVFRDLPLESIHKNAFKASEAAHCAGEQGKFWEFHDKVYAGASDATPPTMKAYAEQIGLDEAKFETCRSTRKYQAQVQADITEGTRMGVSGTPGFFINGRFLSGALSLEAFTKVIDEELEARRGHGAS